MLRQDLSSRSRELRSGRVPFVYARVVFAEQPTSAKPGDEALILEDGSVEGFIGGSCAEATVREQSLALLESGDTLMLRITPVPEEAQPGRTVVHNPCLSGGTLEVFLEAAVPPPLVLVVGQAPIAESLRSLGGALGYELRSFEGPIPPDTAAVVVASHGRGEEGALVAALEAGVRYVGLVASARRGSAVVAGLPVDDEQKRQVRTPAGLDIGARTAAEVALSILADIVQSRRRAPDDTVPVGAARATSATGAEAVAGIDPVCGMPVAAGDAAVHIEHEGRLVWFCGKGCLQAFTADPSAFAG
jgi:xanthine dehydrogenase accessory factor